MKIVYGLNVHKERVFACILNENGAKFECKLGVFVTNGKVVRMVMGNSLLLASMDITQHL